jgi:hypothetical protein
MVGALNGVIGSLVGRGRDHEWLLRRWMHANLLKEAANAAPTQTYAEQTMRRRCQNRRYGPIRRVKYERKVTLKPGDRKSWSHTVEAFGADYFQLDRGAGVAGVEVAVRGKDVELALTVVELDAQGRIVGVTEHGTRRTALQHRARLTGSPTERLGLVVGGIAEGGRYRVQVSAN